jgi:N-acetyl-anhydromuramyl-L-alanine amidase AmpD
MNIKKALLDRKQHCGKRSRAPTQIVLHHTAGSTAKGALEWWNSQSARTGTNYVIDKDGTVYEAVSPDNWIYGLGISVKSNAVNKAYKSPSYSMAIEQLGIGIELVCEGELVVFENKPFYFEGGKKFLKEEDTITFDKPHRGYRTFAKYTQAQLDSMVELVLILKAKYPRIDTKYRDDIYDINLDALRGFPGIYSHVCYRTVNSGKTDCFPQPEFKQALLKISKNNK